MKRRLLLFAGCVVAVLLVGYAVLWATGPNPHVTAENFRKLKQGMTATEVDAILGAPGIPWDRNIKESYLADLGVVFDEDESKFEIVGSLSAAPWEQIKSWAGNGVAIGAVFDADARLVGAELLSVKPISPLAKLRRLLGL